MRGIMVIVYVVLVIVVAAYMTMMERKVMAYVQRRVGPNKVGVSGVMQPLMDGVKLIIKEAVRPVKSGGKYINIGPMIMIGISIMNVMIVPMNNSVVVGVRGGIMVNMVLMSVSVYSIIMSAYISGCNYSVVSMMRVVVQMISYEVVLGMMIMIPGIGNEVKPMEMGDNIYNMRVEIGGWRAGGNVMGSIVMLGIMYVVVLAETNRVPIDLPEAESELVAGYLIEYSSINIIYYQLGEYISIIIMGMIMMNLYIGGGIEGGWKESLGGGIKLLLIMGSIVIVRASIPRYKYKKIVKLCWNEILIIVLGYIIEEEGVKILVV